MSGNVLGCPALDGARVYSERGRRIVDGSSGMLDQDDGCPTGGIGVLTSHGCTPTAAIRLLIRSIISERGGDSERAATWIDSLILYHATF